ncbi:Neurolysin/Thimet oligopeptidase N-terminal [Penicillium crustosum]|uniref:Neurolysin/Thimet oligopeptidase N-terminal n=1 Tax=Penicillium crustosum TaxID=36656 RepID=UPI002385F345|nr:Neurolysin/Thimet oligopeptidase N-terminal [Penicillium crustosum]KAJ5418939.1 Neurolysin/Thimet oligopeptidase N-terminal [Penicillium crustosum]
MRKASSTAVNMVDKTYWGVFQIPFVFSLVNAVYKRHAEKDNNAEVNAKSEDQKLLERFYSMFVENGPELQGDKRDRFLWISNLLIELRVAFMENLSSDPGYVWKDRHELEEIATETLQALPIHSPTSQKGIKLKKPNITMVLTRCHIA